MNLNKIQKGVKSSWNTLAYVGSSVTTNLVAVMPMLSSGGKWSKSELRMIALVRSERLLGSVTSQAKYLATKSLTTGSDRWATKLSKLNTKYEEALIFVIKLEKLDKLLSKSTKKHMKELRGSAKASVKEDLASL